MTYRFLQLCLIACQIYALIFFLPVHADNLDSSTPFPQKPNLLKPIEAPLKLLHPPVPEDMFPRFDMHCVFQPPIPLHGITVYGLTDEGVITLGLNYFAVTATQYDYMSDIYRKTRTSGKSNFITVDALMHPYLAYTNRIIASVAEEHFAPELAVFLKSVLAQTLVDLKQADDMYVRADIEHNAAFLLVGIRLLDPYFKPSVPNHVLNYADADLKALRDAGTAKSAVFEGKIDFAAFQPVGFYNSSAKLADFYRCRMWLSRPGLPITDINYEDSDYGQGNNFRRSVLLYHALDQAKIDGKPAMQLLDRLSTIWPLFGVQPVYGHEQILYPAQYRLMFASLPQDLKVTLSSLAQPFYRTKLLLGIRRQKPVNLEATSVFELGDDERTANAGAVFHLFTPAGEPEFTWLNKAGAFPSTPSNPGTSPEQGQALWPFALYLMHCHQSGQANNCLADSCWKLDPAIVRLLPELERITGAVSNKQSETRLWTLAKTYFEPYPAGESQKVFKTDLWMTHRLESGFACWVDGHVALAAQNPNVPGKKPVHPVPDADVDEPAPKKISYYHYVEPNPQAFRAIKQDADKLSADISALSWFPERYRTRLNDFGKLADRLAKLAALELAGKSMTPSDVQLMANIDSVLEMVDEPLAQSMHIEANDDPQSGVNMSIGHAGRVFLILEHDTKTALGRGAVYRYYENDGPAISQGHWLRKLEFGMVKNPYWTDKFDMGETPAKGRKPQFHPEGIN